MAMADKDGVDVRQVDPGLLQVPEHLEATGSVQEHNIIRRELDADALMRALDVRAAASADEDQASGDAGSAVDGWRPKGGGAQCFHVVRALLRRASLADGPKNLLSGIMNALQ